MKNLLSFAAVLLFVLCVVPNARAQYQITTIGSTITENFDGMVTNTNANATNNASNVINFSGSLNTNTATTQAQRNSAWTINTGNANFGRAGAKGNYTLGTTNSSGGVYSAGNNATTTDRALDFQGTGNASTISSVAQFQNVSGSTITSLLISYTGEQWQTQASLGSFIEVRYSTTSAAAALTGTLLTGTTFNAINTAGPLTSLNGDAAGNRNTSLSNNISGLSVANGQSIYIAFIYNRGTSGASSAQNLAIDDISITAASSSVPASLIWTGSGGTWDTVTAAWKNVSANDTIWDNTANAATVAVFDGSGASTVAVSSGGIIALGLQFTATGYTVAGPGTLTLAGSNIQVTNLADTATVNAVLAGSNGLNKTGAGTLVLGGANTFTGNVSVTAGTMTFSSDGNLGNTANDVILGGGILNPSTTVSLSATRDLSGAGTIKVGSGNTLTFNGTSSTTALTLSDSGTVVLAGGTNAVGALTFTDAGTLSVTGGAASVTTVTTSQAAGTATISGAINLGSVARTFSVANGTASTDLLVSANITSTARLSKQGAGTLELTGTNSGMLGVQLGVQGASPTNGGRLIVNSSDALGSTTNQTQLNYGTLEASSSFVRPGGVSIGGRSGSVLTFAGSNMTFNGTSGAPNQFFKAASTSGELAIVVNNNTTFGGTFAASSAGGSGGTLGTATGITVGGTGTLTIAGDASPIVEKWTTADSVTLSVGPAGKIGAGGLTITTGTTLQLGISSASFATITGNITYGGTLNLDLSTDVGLWTLGTGTGNSGTFDFVNVIGSAYGTVALSSVGGGVWTGTIGDTSFTVSALASGLSFTAIPEPHQYAVALGGLLAVAIFVRRRKARMSA